MSAYNREERQKQGVFDSLKWILLIQNSVGISHQVIENFERCIMWLLQSIHRQAPLLAILVMVFSLAACSSSTYAEITRPELPGKLVVYDGETNQFKQYMASGTEAFVPVKGYSLPEIVKGYSPTVSLDGQWSIAFDQALLRFVVTGPNKRYVIEEHILALGNVAWSPDSQYLVYTANDQQGEWAGRLTVLTLADGTKQWIGIGIHPRWYP